MNKSPHIDHVVLDRYFKNVYRQRHHSDEQGHNMVDILGNMRGEIWWVAIENEGQSKRRKQGFVQRKQGGVIGLDDMVIHLMGKEWQYKAERCSEEQWIKSCRDAAHKYYISKNLPVDPRRKTEEDSKRKGKGKGKGTKGNDEDGDVKGNKGKR